MIRRLRERRGYTKDKLGRLVGVSPKAVAKWESGESVPTLFNCIKLAEIFGLTAEALAAGLKETASVRKENKLYMMGGVDVSKREVAIDNGGCSCCDESADYSFHPKMPDYCCRCYIDLDEDTCIDREMFEDVYYKAEREGEESLDKLEKLVLEGLCAECYEAIEDGEDF